MKRFKRILFYFTLTVATLVLALLISVYLFKDRIIKQFINEANKSLATPISIRKIDVSALTDFPSLAIVFHDVYVEDSHPGKDTLLTARTISFRLNPIEVWQGNYNVQALRIEKSITRLRVNAVGKENYIILKEGSGGGTGTIKFNLENVKIVDTEVSYEDKQSKHSHLFRSDFLEASIGINGDLYKIHAEGDLTTEQIGVDGQLFLVKKEFDAVADIDYDDENKIVTINPSTLDLQRSAFEVTGTYKFKEKNLIDIEAHGKDTDIQTVLSLLPDGFSKQFRDYQSDGDVYFTFNVRGEMSARKDPVFSIAFGCTDATVFHPSYNSRITKANLEGSFATPSFSSLAEARLFLKNVRGELNGEPFEADFGLINFDNPIIDLKFKGNVDAKSIMSFYPIPGVNEMSGVVRADVEFSGEVGLLKKRTTAQQVKASGTLDLADLNLSLGKRPVIISGLSGALQFNNNDLALSNCVGVIGNSDFVLNGLFKNSVTFLLFENQPIGIEADLRSKFLDLDELFSIAFGNQASGEYQFAISPNVHLNFNCSVRSLHYRRFKPRKIAGNLLIKNQMAVSRKLSFDAMGGSLTLDGIVDAKNPKAIDVVSGFKLTGVHLDSLFFVFENFKQDFIQDKHLKGHVTAEVNTEMNLNEKLNLFPETLVADISATIKNGELNNFEPMKSLNRYLDDEGLSKLRFADLRNDIHIENKVIIIPQMEISSNVTTIQLSGTHTFDQHIDYRVTAPLRNKKKIDPDEAFGAIEDDGGGRMKIFLKITGTTDDYNVSYDKQALKKKIASDLKKEVKELREAIKLKGNKKKKEAELSDEEFDWNDN
ncbi:MAG TPA: AsmA-like C-terminal region-containing protein [Cyclobacteriaceae bacterium]|nr:AsmA-like C-terminal region-containing protein [Cyclobacteriaceae bacterium]